MISRGRGGSSSSSSSIEAELLFLPSIGRGKKKGAKGGTFDRMGRLFVVQLEGSKIYSCKHCHTHLAHSDHIVSRNFHCKHGKAYLFNKVVNVTVGVKEERIMMTGKHTVADIFCVTCGSIVGWKYEAAHEKSQKYKEGKFILERFKITGPDGTSYWSSHDTPVGSSDADDA